MSKGMYHPCHKLSVPSAKIFWCRHCMQMFEDAISRWKHSKICRYNSTVNKDQDGQVIQMYIKPDKVSYTENFLPGQRVYHKPQVKKTTADLKCVICNTKFYSLHDMREHVKLPCQRSLNNGETDSADSDSEVQHESVNYKIRRVELDDVAVQSSTALAVLAEASQHVESLSHRHRIWEDRIQEFGQYIHGVPEVEQVVEVAPVYPSYSTINSVTESLISTDTVGVTPRTDLEPLNIVIQTEDGQDLPESSLNEESVEFYLGEIANSLHVGQILQIQLKDKFVKNYIVGPDAKIYPRENYQQPGLQITEIRSNCKNTPALGESCNIETSVESPVIALATETNYTNNKGTKNNPLIDLTSGDYENCLVVPKNSQKSVSSASGLNPLEILSHSVNQEILNSNSSNYITETEHSYQLPNSKPSHIKVTSNAHRQQTDQGNQVNFDILEEKQESFNVNEPGHNIVPVVQPVACNSVQIYTDFPQQEISQQTNTGQLRTIDTLPYQVEPEVVEVPVAYFEEKSNTEGAQAVDIVNNLVSLYSSTYKVGGMAEKQKLLTPVVDLFGFAELTGEICDVPTPCLTQTHRTHESSSYGNHTLAHRRDENEVIVPILSDRRGFTKYKVLARLKPEEDEVTKPPSYKDTVVSSNKGSSKSESLKLAKENTASIVQEQRNNEVKKKSDQVKPIPSSNVKGKAGLNNSKTESKMCKSIKLKQKCKVLARDRDREKKTCKLMPLTKSKLCEDVNGDLSKKRKLVDKPQKCMESGLNSKTQAIADSQRKDNVEKPLVNPSQTSGIVGKACEVTDHDEGPCCVSNEFVSLDSSNSMRKLEGSLIDSNTNLKENSGTTCEKMDVTESELDTSQSGGERDQSDSDNSYIQSAQPLNKCFVSIERCPSSEDLSKGFLDDREHSTFEKKRKVPYDSETKIKKLNVSRQSSDSGNSISDLPYQVLVKRKKSSDERIAMVYDTNIDVRKSGRLKSAKCASRYRGDYGIRADIYNKITCKKIETHSSKHSSDTSVITKTLNNVPLKEESYSFSPSEKSEDRFCNETARQQEIYDHINQNCSLNIMPKIETSSDSVVEAPGILKHNSQVPCSEISVNDKYTDSCDCTNNECLSEILSSSQNSANSENNPDSNFFGEDVSQGNFLSVLGKTGYVHSVGKSVNKKQNYISKRSRCESNEMEMAFPLSPESTPEKCDSSQLLEKLRCKMFEKVGLTAQSKDTQPKQFESKLISSKLKKTLLDSDDGAHAVNSITSEHALIPKSFLGCIDYHKSPPRCSTPTIVSSTVSILDEVAEKLNSMHKAKRKSEGKQSKPKRQRFQEKKFMLRSMFKSSKTLDEPHLGDSHNSLHDEESSSVKGETTDSDIFSNTCDDTDVRSVDDSFTDSHKADNSNAESDVTVDKTKAKKERAFKQNICDIQETNIVKKKPKSVKCHACCQTFRSKEIMRKHYPCRVRQTRTWSQNKLRPNRVFRNDNFSKKKVNKLNTKLSKSGKQNKARPQLLTPRKTKFRRVKGKRRRRLYQLIQELMSKRQIMDWPHLNVLYTHLSFKEQCLYRLGLFCVGNKSEGLENYSEEDLRVFKVHQEKEKEFYFSRNFKHIFPSSDDESRDSLSDSKEVCDTFNNVPSVNVSTEFSDSFSTCKETSFIENLSAEKEARYIDGNFTTGPCASTSCELSQSGNDLNLTFEQTHSSMADTFLKKSDSYEVKDVLSVEEEIVEKMPCEVIQHPEQGKIDKNIVEDQHLSTPIETNSISGDMHKKQTHASDRIKIYCDESDFHFPKADSRLSKGDIVKLSTQVSTMVEETLSVPSNVDPCQFTSHSQTVQINEKSHDNLENAKFQESDYQNRVKPNVFEDMQKQESGDTLMMESENQEGNELMNSKSNTYSDLDSEIPQSGLRNTAADTQNLIEEADSTDSVPVFTDKDFSSEFLKGKDTEHNSYEINGSHVEEIPASNVKRFDNECTNESQSTLLLQMDLNRQFHKSKFEKDVSEKCDIKKFEKEIPEISYLSTGNTIQERNEIEKEFFCTHIEEITGNIKTDKNECYYENHNTLLKETEVNSERLNPIVETDFCQTCDTEENETNYSQNLREITHLGIGNNSQKNHGMAKDEYNCGNTFTSKEPDDNDSEAHDTSFSVSECTDDSLAVSPEAAAHEVIEKFFLISKKIEAYMHFSITNDRQSNNSSFQAQKTCSDYKLLSDSNQTEKTSNSLTASTDLEQKESNCIKTLGGEENIEKFFELSEKLEAYIQHSSASHTLTDDVHGVTLVKTKKEESNLQCKELFWANKYVPKTDNKDLPHDSSIDGEMSYEDGCIKRLKVKESDHMEESNRQKQGIHVEENISKSVEINSDHDNMASTHEKFLRNDNSCEMTVNEESVTRNENDFDPKSDYENKLLQVNTNEICCVESLKYIASDMTSKEKEICGEKERANSLLKDENKSMQSTVISQRGIWPSCVIETDGHETEKIAYLEREPSVPKRGSISIQVTSDCKFDKENDRKGLVYNQNQELHCETLENTNEINKEDEDIEFNRSVKIEGFNTASENLANDEEKNNQLITKNKTNSVFKVKNGSLNDCKDTTYGKDITQCNNYNTNKDSFVSLDNENPQTVNEPKVNSIEICRTVDIADVEENNDTGENLEHIKNQQFIAPKADKNKELTRIQEKESNSSVKSCSVSIDEDIGVECNVNPSKGNILQEEEKSLEVIRKTECDEETNSNQSFSDVKNETAENESIEEINHSLIPTSSSPMIKSSSQKAPAVIKYKINGVYFSENLETGVKEVITDEYCVTDINIESSQESSFEVSQDEDGSVIENSDINNETLGYDSESILKNVEIHAPDENEIVPENVTENTNTCATDMFLSNTSPRQGTTKLDESFKSQEEVCMDNACSLNNSSVSELETNDQLTNGDCNRIIEDHKETKNDSPVEEDKENISIERSQKELLSSPVDEIEIMRSGSDPNTTNNSLGLPLIDEINSDSLSLKGEQSLDLFQKIVEEEDMEAIHTEPPPILEREVEGTSPLNFVPEKCGLNVISESGPPTLEPVKRQRVERHFLDIIGEIYEKKSENDIKVSQTNKLVNGTKESFDLANKLQKDNEDLPITDNILANEYNSYDDEIANSLTEFPYKEDIGRHFSDVIDATCSEKQKLPEMQMLFEKSEKGDVTLAQIRSLLTPTSKKGIEIPKDTLLKIRSGVENIISKVKLPTKKDPVWLKRDALLNYKSRKDTDVSCEDGALNGDAVREIVFKEDEHISSNYNSDSTSGGITDSILQMLTSLEDKGSFAENMTNLLHILAENLGFSRSNSDSNEEYLCNEGVETDIVSKNRLSLDDFESQLQEIGEEPPPLDEISFEVGLSPFAGVNDNESSSCNEKDDFEQYLDTENQSDFKDGIFEEKRSVHGNENSTNDLSSKSESTESKIDAGRQSSKIHTLFKSITELNSIETDDDSESEEIFDVATMSQRMSELKSISKVAVESDGNSEVFSDDENCFEEDLNIPSGEDESKTCTGIFEKCSLRNMLEDSVIGKGINETCSTQSIQDKNFRQVELLEIEIGPNQNLPTVNIEEGSENDKNKELYHNFLTESCVEETDKLKDSSKDESVKGDSSTQNDFDACLVFGSYDNSSERNGDSEQHFQYNSNNKEQLTIENHEKEEINNLHYQSDNFEETDYGQDLDNALSNEKEGLVKRNRIMEEQTKYILNKVTGQNNLKENEEHFIDNHLPSSYEEYPPRDSKDVQKRTNEFFFQKQISNKNPYKHADDITLELDRLSPEYASNEKRFGENCVEKETNQEFDERVEENFDVKRRKTKVNQSFLELKEIEISKERGNYIEKEELSDLDDFITETGQECDSDGSVKWFGEMKEANIENAYISSSLSVSEDNEMTSVYMDEEHLNSNRIFETRDMDHLKAFESNGDVKEDHLNGFNFEKIENNSPGEFVENSYPLLNSPCNSQLSISSKDHENNLNFTTNGMNESFVQFSMQLDSDKSENNKELLSDDKNDDQTNLEQLCATSCLESDDKLEKIFTGKNSSSQEEEICQSPSCKKSNFEISSGSLITWEKSSSGIDSDPDIRNLDKYETHEEMILQNNIYILKQIESYDKANESTKTCDAVIDSSMNASKYVDETIRDITNNSESFPNVDGSSHSDKCSANENSEIDMVISYRVEKKFEFNQNEARDIQSESTVYSRMTVNNVECNHQVEEMETHDDPEQIVDSEKPIYHGNLTAEETRDVSQQIFDRETAENNCNLTAEEEKGHEIVQTEENDLDTFHLETHIEVPGESGMNESKKPSNDSQDSIDQASLNTTQYEFPSCNGAQCADEDSNNTVVYETDTNLATDQNKAFKGASLEDHAIDNGEFPNCWNFGGFCETIAEKVKRKQKERLIKLDQARSRYRTFYSQPKNSTDRPKEFSVFRKTMLQTKADRNKKSSITLEDDNQENNKRARSTSVPKDMHMPPCSVVLNEMINEITEKEIQRKIDVKPCSVKLERLDRKIVERYTVKERYTEKVGEVTHFPISRPPIRFKISLKNLCVKPCSPRPSYISDAASGNSSGMEESESEYSDDISEKDSVCIESGEWIQSPQYKVYEIKNSPRTFHRSLEECKPIKLKVKSVSTNVAEGDENIVQETVNEKVNRSLFSAFDDVLLKNLPSPLNEINENDSPDSVTKKSPVKATWIKDLRLSDSESSENESDKEEAINSIAKTLHSTETKQPRSPETTIVSDNSSKQNTVNNAHCLDNICSIESPNLISTDYSKIESAEFQEIENEFAIDWISQSQKVIKNSNKNLQEVPMLPLESDPSCTLEKTQSAIKTGSQQNTLKQEKDHSFNKNEYISTDNQFETFDNIPEMQKIESMKKTDTTQKSFEEDDRLQSVEGNVECNLTMIVSLDSDMNMPLSNFEKSLESTFDFNTEQVEICKDTENPQVLPTVCGDSIMDDEIMLKTDMSNSNKDFLYSDLITEMKSTEVNELVEDSVTQILVNKKNEQGPSEEASEIDSFVEVDTVDTSQDPVKMLAEKSPSLTGKEIEVNDNDLLKGDDCEKSCQGKKSFEEDYRKLPDITKLDNTEIQEEGVELDSFNTSDIFIGDLDKKESTTEMVKVNNCDSDTMDVEENISAEDLSDLPEEDQNEIREKIEQHNEIEKLSDIIDLKKTKIEEKGADLDSSNTSVTCDMNTKEQTTVSMGDENYNRSTIEIENNCKEKYLKVLSDGEKKEIRDNDKEIKHRSGTEKSSDIAELESTKTKEERVDLDVSDSFDHFTNDLNEKEHATKKIIDQNYDRSTTEKADTKCPEKYLDELPNSEQNEIIGIDKEKKRHCETEQGLHSMDLCSSERENDLAILGLEDEHFDKSYISDIAVEEGDEIIYYAVEVNEDYEANEAISNIEQCEQERIIPDCEQVAVLETCELQTNIIESIAVEGYEIKEGNVCENVIDIGEANEIVGHEEIIPGNEVEACSTEITGISCVAMVETQNRFLCGINDDSQSSQELIEECVMDFSEVQLQNSL